MQQDSILKTFVVASVLCIVCSIFVSTAAVMLKPLQEANKELDKQANILAASGLVDLHKAYPTQARVDELSKSVTALTFDVKTNTVYFLPKNELPAGGVEMVDLDGFDLAKIRQMPRFVEFYVCSDSGNPITDAEQLRTDATRFVFPIEGTGLWSLMRGFIALEFADSKTESGEKQLNKVVNILFYQQGETAGLGGEIANPKWQAKWKDKIIYAGRSSEPTITVLRPGIPNNGDDQIDGIAGSTLTGNGVQNTVRFWLGNHGFGPLIHGINTGNISTGTLEDFRKGVTPTKFNGGPSDEKKRTETSSVADSVADEDTTPAATDATGEE